ncbi:MAG: magnesium transporter CorA family protein [Candidatus Gracilibacteria bacterium]|nr:magnesium transporter CorA family protein [Candidatus Gracilibacteria bacterium]
MLRKLNVGGIRWIDGVNLKDEEIIKVLSSFDFHELDIEACLEENQRARIDSYEDYLFMVLHFPKYNKRNKVYELNEFNVFLGRDYLITFRRKTGGYVDKVFDMYSDKKLKKDEEFKLSSAFVLYEILQSMLEKMFKMTENITRDLKLIEDRVFDKTSYSLVKEIMIKKRNIIVLKNMFVPQVSVMKLMEFKVNKLFSGEVLEYFEDLEDKITHVVSDTKIIEEYVNSIEDAFISITNINTNRVMSFLAFFSAFMLPLTFITSFYGMNIDLPFQNNSNIIYLFLFYTSIIMVLIFVYFKKKRNI